LRASPQTRQLSLKLGTAKPLAAHWQRPGLVREKDVTV
jgi:hypothetical protein